MEDKEVTSDSKHGFTEGKLCLTNLVAFCYSSGPWPAIKGHAVACPPSRCWGGEENGKKKARTRGSG